MLTGVALGLPICQGLMASRQTMVVQQCKTTLVKVEAQKTKCGFQPCLWDGFVNLNGETYEYVTKLTN